MPLAWRRGRRVDLEALLGAHIAQQAAGAVQGLAAVAQHGLALALQRGRIEKQAAVAAHSSAVDAVKKDEAVFKSFKEFKTFGDNITALMDLSAGRLNAVVVDEVVGRYLVSKKPGQYVVLDENFGTEDYGVGVRKDDTELLGKLDKALADMKQDGTAGQIATKWFGKNIVK